MIVKCDKCQTRFKIPDEKVTEKGVKVRCTKCQNTFRVSKSQDASPPPPVPAAPSGPTSKPDTDPFARFGSPELPNPLEATRPGLFPEGIAATRQPLAPSYSAQSDLPQELFDQPTRIAPVPKGLLELTPPSGPALAEESAPAPELAPTPAPAASAPPSEMAGFDPSNPFDPSDPFALPPLPSAGDAGPGAPSGLAATSVQSSPPPLPSSAPAPELSEPSAVAMAVSSIPDFPPAAATSSAHPSDPVDSLLGDLPGAEDPFAADSALQDFGVTNGGGEAEPDRGLFDMPAPPPPSPTPSPLIDDDVIPTATVPRPSLVTPSVERPAGRPEDVGMSEGRRPGAVRRTVGLVVNLVVASALVVLLLSVGTIYLNEGKLDPSALSLEPVKALFASPGVLRTLDVSNGLYDTAGGRPVFYVRGEVENRGDKPMRAKVRVQILDGTTSVTEAEIFAGRAPNPEELYGVTNEETLAALSQQLNQAAVEVKPKSRAPFLVAFYEYPPELGEYRLKVTVEQAPGETAAR